MNRPERMIDLSEEQAEVVSRLAERFASVRVSRVGREGVATLWREPEGWEHPQSVYNADGNIWAGIVNLGELVPV